MGDDPIDGVLFNNRAYAGDVSQGVHNTGADLPVAVHLGLFVLGQKEFESGDQADDLFLRRLCSPSYSLVRTAVQHCSPNEIVSPGENPRTLRSTDALAATIIHQISPQAHVLEQVLAWRQHRCGIHHDWNAMPMGYLADLLEVQNTRRAGEGRDEIDHGGRLCVDCTLQFVWCRATSYTNLNQDTPRHPKGLIVHEAVGTLDDKFILHPSGVWETGHPGRIVSRHTRC